MKILMTGASGFVGRTLARFLRNGGHEVVPLPRVEAGERIPSWDPSCGRIDLTGVEGIEGVVHLAGESIMGRWTKAKKQRIRDSRISGTRILCEALAGLPDRPGVLVSASAVGYYGDAGEAVLDESSPPGNDFLAGVAVGWESATKVAANNGIRTVPLRIGLVLSSEGGALKQMLPVFKLGLGGRVGSGQQWWSWIALDDLHNLILHALTRPTVEGPLNACTPEPVTNQEFTRTLAHVLKRPALLPMPEKILKTIFGEMGEATLLASTRVLPRATEEAGYPFRYSSLEPALRHLLGR